MSIFAFIVIASLAALAAYVLGVQRARVELEAARLGEARAKEEAAQIRIRLEEERAALLSAEGRFKDAFKSLAGDALKESILQLNGMNEQMLKQGRGELEGQLEARKAAVEGWTKGLGEQVEALRRFSEEVSRRQMGGEERLSQMIKSLNEGQERLSRATLDLGNALSSNQARGELGEIALIQLLQWAGLAEGIHYLTQSHADSGGKAVRPDVVVMLPDKRELLVDSKMVLDAFLSASREEDPVRRGEFLKAHAAHLRQTIDRLSAKEYSAQFPRAADFVILFLPNDALLSSALQADPSLSQRALQKRVVLATPSNLIPMLKLVDRAWQDSKLTENAKLVASLAGELLDRMHPFIVHVAGAGKDLNAAVASYNQAIASLDSSVFPQTRRIRELGVPTQKDPTAKDVPKVIEAQADTARVERLQEKVQQELNMKLN